MDKEDVALHIFWAVCICFAIFGFGLGIYCSMYYSPTQTEIIDKTCSQYCEPFQVSSCHRRDGKIFYPNYIDVIVACDNSANKKVEHIIGYK